jgi:hypothetical protein
MTQKTNPNPWILDVRVRERNLTKGLITDKEVEKHLQALPDMADQAEPFATPQPALAQPEIEEEEDDEEDDIEEEDEPAAPENGAPQT